MSNPLFDALQEHTKTPVDSSKDAIRKAVEVAWMHSRTKTIEGHGLGVDILLAAIMGMDGRSREKLISTRDFNAIYSLATAMQGKAAQFWAHDIKCQLLHGRLVEAQVAIEPASTYTWRRAV